MHGSNLCTTVLSHVLTLSYPMTSCDIVSLSFIMSLLAMSLRLRFCVSRKGVTGEGVWVYPNGANNMAVSGLTCRKALVGTGRANSILFGINGLRNEPSYLAGPPFLAFTAYFSAMPGWHFQRALTEIGVCG